MKLDSLRNGAGLLLIALLAGCATNSLVIGYFYGQLDNRMAERILSAAEFTNTQQAEVQRSVDEFFAWHRREELPRYGDVLERIANDIEANRVDEAQVMEHMQRVRGFAGEAFLRSPFANSAAFLSNLSDTQVEQVAAHFEERDEAFREWLKERQEAGGEEKRVDQIVKNIGRFGVNLNDNQREIIAGGLARLDSDPEDRHALWNRWEAEFLDLLEERNQPEFADRIDAHLALYQDQMRIHRPEIYKKNQQVVAMMVSDVLRSLDPRQRSTLLTRLAQTRKSLQKVAAG